MVIRKVGNTRIIREVGRGGMGVVYEGEQEELERKVAVKELPAELAVRKDFVERFRREGLAYARLKHHAIVTVHDLVEKNDSLYLITEFVQGCDVEKLLKNGGALPADCVAILGARVAEALDHVHLHKMVHRDVKPSNVMVDVDGAVKLMDFGIVKDQDADALTKTGLVVGSPPYMSPESLSGEAPGKPGDIWALGVMLYELSTGSRPFAGKDSSTLFSTIRKGAFIPVRRRAPGVPRKLANAIERCLRTKPNQRWDSAAELARELDSVAGRLLDGKHPQVRLISLMMERGQLKPEDVTIIDASALIVPSSSISVEIVEEENIRPRRWPYLVGALATGGALAAYVTGAAAPLLKWFH